MDEQHRNEAERTEFEAAVMSIARSHGIDAREVQSLYDSVLAELTREAIVMDFFPILAARKVKEMLLLKSTSLRNAVCRYAVSLPSERTSRACSLEIPQGESFIPDRPCPSSVNGSN